MNGFVKSTAATALGAAIGTAATLGIGGKIDITEATSTNAVAAVSFDARTTQSANAYYKWLAAYEAKNGKLQILDYDAATGERLFRRMKDGRLIAKRIGQTARKVSVWKGKEVK